MFQQLSEYSNRSTLGAAFRRGIGGQVVDTFDIDNAAKSNVSAAAIISNQALNGATSLNMLIIDKPTTYRQVDNSANRTLASSVIVVSVQRNSSAPSPMNISLYFQVLNEYQPNHVAEYFCSFYDTTHSRWNESGCTKPQNNFAFNRYECSCNHLSTFALVWAPYVVPCGNTTHMSAPNGSCVPKIEVQAITVDTLRRNDTNSSVIAENLSLYISSITNSNTTSNSSNTLTVNEIDTLISRINDTNITKNTADSILVAQQPNQGDNIIVLGASFTRGVGGKVVNTANKENVTNSHLSTAAIISNQSLTGVISLNMLIIDKPTTYENIDNSTNKTLASSVIVMSIRRDSSASVPMNISLYFQVLNEYKPNLSADYFCSFYDTTNFTWNEFGCTKPQYSPTFDRYECNCNHTTSFALIWLPKVPLTRYLNAQDIASLVFQSISICCFLAIIIHAIVIRIRDSKMSLRTYDLPPLISCGTTMILFVFYIALAMTVYTKETYDDENQCFLSSSVLMFFVYFFLIFMLCTKTSVAYFDYLRFVYLFPPPPYQQLLTMLVVSFFVSITWVAFAAGFNSSSSFHITQLYPYKLCWFTRPAIYYFLTIPVGLFLIINIFIFIRVAQRMVSHARNATVHHGSFERRKQCVILLLFSCATQGIGWLFGPFLTIATPEAANVLGWFFIIFNGLEGLWVIILYAIIRLERIGEQIRILPAEEIRKSRTSKLTTSKDKKSFEEENEKEDRRITRDTEVRYQNRRKQTSRSFDDFRDIVMMDPDVDDHSETSFC